MRNITQLLLILIFPFAINAQKTQIDWGEIYTPKTENGKSFFSRKMIGFIGEEYFLHASTRKKQHLLKFNSQNKLVKTSSIDFEYEDKKIDLLDLLNTASDNFLVSFRHYAKTKENKYFINKFNTDGTVSQNVNLLFSHRYIRDKGMRDYQTSDDNKDVSGIWISDDSTKVLFASVESKYEFNKKKGNDVFHFALFDNQMNLIWQEALTFPYADKKINVKSFAITNNGGIYAHAEVKAEEKRKTKYPKTNISLFKIEKEGIVEIDQLNITNKYLGEGSLHVNNDNSLFYAGTYMGRKDKVGTWKGLFLVKYDKTGKEVFKNTYKWTNQIKEKLDLKWHIKFKNSLIDYNNKTLTIAIENDFYKETQSQISNRGTHDIILPSFSFDGELRWMTLIEKEFDLSETSSASSFLFAHKDENIYLLFNDKKNKQERKKLSASRNLFASSYFMDITKINIHGEIELRETLINSKEFKFFFDVSESAFVKNGKILIAGEGNVNGDYRFGNILLD